MEKPLPDDPIGRPDAKYDWAPRALIFGIKRVTCTSLEYVSLWTKTDVV